MKSICKLIIILASLSVSSVFANYLLLNGINNNTNQYLTVKIHDNDGGHYSDIVRRMAPGQRIDVKQDIADEGWDTYSHFAITIIGEDANITKVYNCWTKYSWSGVFVAWFSITIDGMPDKLDTNVYFFTGAAYTHLDIDSFDKLQFG